MRCEICGCEPCQTPGFCEHCRRVDRDPKVIAKRDRATAALPKYGKSMDVGALWEALNDPRLQTLERGGDAPQTTYDALLWSLIDNNGWAGPRRADNQRRLTQLSDRQLQELVAALRRKNCDPVLIAEIESYA